MKRQAVLISIGLIAGIGLGYALGVHHTLPAHPETSAASSPAAVAIPETPAKAGSHSNIPLTADDAQHLLTAWASSKSAGMDNDQLRKCLILWSESDPYAVLGFIEENFGGSIRNYAFAFPLSVIGRQNPQAAAGWIRTRPSFADRNSIAKLTVELLTRSAPRMALTIAEELQLNLGALEQSFLFGALAANAPAEAQAAFAKLPAHRRAAVALAVGRGLVKSDPQAALQWCRCLGETPESIGAIQGVIAELALNLGDEKALDAINQLNPSRTALDEVAKTLKWDSPEAALALLPKLSPSVSAELAERFVNDDFTDTPDEMLALARAYLPPDKANAALVAAWADWETSQPAAADAWLAKIAEPNQRALFEQVKLRYLSDAAPLAYLEQIVASPFPATEHETIEEALGDVSPAQAAHWVATNPTILSPESTEQIVANFYEQEAIAASTWALCLPHGEGQDRVLAAIAEAALKAGDSTQAAATIAAITSPKLQTGMRFKVFATLYRKDRAAATQWLAAEPVASEIRANWEALAASRVSAE